MWISNTRTCVSISIFNETRLPSPWTAAGSRCISGGKNFLLQRVKQQGLTLIMLANDLDFTLHVADKVLFITTEKVYCFGSIAELKACNDDVVAEFIGKK